MRRSVVLLGMILIVAVLAGCGQQATPEPVTYTLEMSEYAFSPDTITVKVGQPVTLELINTGALEHEIMFGQDVMMTNSRPDGYEEDMFAAGNVEPEVMEMPATSEGAMEDHSDEEDMHMEDHEGFMVILPKTGDRATLTFTPTQDMVGEWEMGCFEQDGVHYDAGMKGTLIVEP